MADDVEVQAIISALNSKLGRNYSVLTEKQIHVILSCANTDFFVHFTDRYINFQTFDFVVIFSLLELWGLS